MLLISMPAIDFMQKTSSESSAGFVFKVHRHKVKKKGNDQELIQVVIL